MKVSHRESLVSGKVSVRTFNRSNSLKQFGEVPIFLDNVRTFDTLWHDSLMFSRLSVMPALLEQVGSYLHDGTFGVRADGKV